MKRILVFALMTLIIILAAFPAAGAQAETPAQVGAGADEPTGSSSALSFDVSTTGWKNFSDIRCHIWELSGDTLNPWGGKAGKCADNGDGTWVYDLSAHDISLQQGVQYGVIFYAYPSMTQTYNLIAGVECLGDTAYCDGTVYENPLNSESTTQAAFWRGQDPKVYGPELKISSIGTVVGTCCPSNTSPYLMFVDFLKNTLTNARTYSGKNDQQLLDDTAAALGLGQGDISSAIKESGVSGVEWKETDSKADEGSSQSAHTTGSGSSDGSAAASSGGSGSSAGARSGSAEAAKTGQSPAALLTALTAMAIAAFGIFVLRKQER